VALTEQDLLDLIEKVRPWKKKDKRAPHKPLLLLMALGRLQRGEDRLVAFTEVEADLRHLLRKYGPPRRAYHPEYPFWRLQNDSLWEVPGGHRLATRKSNNDPPVTEMRKVAGGLPEPIFHLLRDRPELVERLAVAILDEHFEDSYETRLLNDVGLRIDGWSWSRRRKRDPRFRLLVLEAYEGRCAVCGLDAVLEGDPVGLEAAHVKSHKHRGPDTVDNGLCMCALHHEAFDLGVLGLTHDHRVLVSDWLKGGASVDEYFRRYHRERLQGPVSGAASIASKHIEWHWKNVFKRDVKAA
jgi:putative restriction endonuclease